VNVLMSLFQCVCMSDYLLLSEERGLCICKNCIEGMVTEIQITD
jgi:hypothetical protein